MTLFSPGTKSWYKKCRISSFHRTPGTVSIYSFKTADLYGVMYLPFFQLYENIWPLRLLTTIYCIFLSDEYVILPWREVKAKNVNVLLFIYIYKFFPTLSRAGLGNICTKNLKIVWICILYHEITVKLNLSWSKILDFEA